MRRLNLSRLHSDYLCEQFEKLPHNNSLADYHYILSWIGIDNMAVHVSPDTLATELPLPAIVHLDNNGVPFAIVDKMDDDTVIMTAGKSTRSVSRENFDNAFSGNCVVFAADTPNVMNKKDFIRWLIIKISKHILSTMLIIAMIICLLTPSIDIFEVIYSVLFLSGLATSVMLFFKQEGGQIKLADTICHSGGEFTSCNTIMSSKGGKIFDIISWSDIGVIYFATAFISLLIIGYDGLGLIISILSLISFPYVFYSIWYQWRKIRKWCPLCLIVQAVFIVQFIVTIITFNNIETQFNPLSLIVFCIIGIIIATSLFVLKPAINNAIKYPFMEKDFRAFRNQVEVKNFLMNKTHYDMSTVNQIIFNPDAKDIITFVFSTFCGPCLIKIKGILQLFVKYDIGLRIVMPLKNIENEKELSLIEYFISQYYESPEKFIQLLRRYSEDYTAIRQKYGTFKAPNSERVYSIVNSHFRWFHSNDINGTPAVLFNNNKLPDYYNLHDLEIIILEKQ